MIFTQVKIEVYLPKEQIAPVVDALAGIGACTVGLYDHVASYAPVEGTWRPLPGSVPYAGETNRLCHGTEYKLELRCPAEQIRAAINLIRHMHPYEEPVINVIPLLNVE